MRALLDDVSQSPTPLAVLSRDRVVRAIKDAHLALIRAALAIHVDPAQIAALCLSLRRYALWLEDAALDGAEMLEQEEDSALNLAATLYEFVGRLDAERTLAGPQTIFEPPLNDFLRAALIASLTEYQAQSTYLARRIEDELQPIEVASAVDNAHNLVARIIVSFMARHFDKAVAYGARLDQVTPIARNELAANDSPNQTIYALDRALALGRACRAAAVGMLIGISAMVVHAGQTFGRIAEASLASEDARSYWLSQRLQRVVERMHQANMHRVLGDAGVPATYRHALARDGIYELWGPQLAAIETGLFGTDEPRNYVVSLPTGAGKTLIAELAILNALRRAEPTWVLYITPSRALVSQVSSDLRHRLADSRVIVRTVVAGAEQAVLLTEELEDLVQDRSVTITTPEKCDAYYRNAKDIFSTCALIIIDEAHKIGEPGRGPLVESLVTRFLVQQPQIRVMLLSGSLSNHEELVEWLGEGSTTSIVATRRPTRQVRGVVVRTALAPRNSRRSGTTLTRRVNFEGGLVLVHGAVDLGVPIAVNVSDLFAGHFTEKQYGNAWREERTLTHSSMIDHAVGIAEVLSRLPGTTLVFVQQARWAESCCDRFPYTDDGRYSAERGKLATFLSDQLGENHKLVQHCLRGVAYHHARLPGGVQRAVELGLKRGWLRVVFTTSTLREGLNTAATNVVLAGDTYYDEAEAVQVPIREPDFEQLAGRAGRPLQETEGRVILIPYSLAQAQAITAARRYMLMGEDALRVRSQLRALAGQLERNEDNLMSMPESDQSLLLALLAAGLEDHDAFASFFGQSLWSVQESDGELIDATVAACERTFGRASNTVGIDRLNLAARTGLALSSMERLREALDAHDPAIFDATGEDQSVIILSVLLEASLMASEVRKGELRKDIPWSTHLEPLRAWIAGQPYGEIAVTAFESGILSRQDDVGGAVKYCADMSMWLSWAFGACYTVLQGSGREINSWIGVLPLLVKYGVSTLAAAYISLLGLSDRLLAEALGKMFYSTGRPESLHEVATWMSEFSPEIERRYPGGDLRGELVQQVFGGRRRALPYLMVMATVEGPVTIGEFLTLNQTARGGINISDHRGNKVGTIDNPALVRRSLGDKLYEATLVSVDAAPSGASAIRIAVVYQA